ncbi:MAG: GNAT family N-acetyltransferase [Gemmatimonadota bacterium]|nr:GNAT family N-acetyltransferase [Gemmatimonadota bacterium]
MAVSIRRLSPGDEGILELLATEDADFDVAERAGPLTPLDSAAARAYLANPAVLHWVAVDGEEVVGDLACILLPLRAGEGQELLLYEIGVRSSRRRRGVGRSLLAHMESWMRANGVGEVWVLADNPAAAEFYRACGFAAEDPQPVYMSRKLRTGDR